MPITESFLMCKHLSIVELSQELPVMPFQIGANAFICPYSPHPYAQFSIVYKTPKASLPLFRLGAVFVWVSEAGGWRFPSPIGLALGSSPTTLKLPAAAAFGINPIHVTLQLQESRLTS